MHSIFTTIAAYYLTNRGPGDDNSRTGQYSLNGVCRGDQLVYTGARAGSQERAGLVIETRRFRSWVAAAVLAVNVALMLAPASVALLALAGVLR